MLDFPDIYKISTLRLTFNQGIGMKIKTQPVQKHRRQARIIAMMDVSLMHSFAGFPHMYDQRASAYSDTETDAILHLQVSIFH